MCLQTYPTKCACKLINPQTFLQTYPTKCACKLINPQTFANLSHQICLQTYPTKCASKLINPQTFLQIYPTKCACKLIPPNLPANSSYEPAKICRHEWFLCALEKLYYCVMKNWKMHWSHLPSTLHFSFKLVYCFLLWLLVGVLCKKFMNFMSVSLSFYSLHSCLHFIFTLLLSLVVHLLQHRLCFLLKLYFPSLFLFQNLLLEVKKEKGRLGWEIICLFGDSGGTEVLCAQHSTIYIDQPPLKMRRTNTT